MSWARHLPRFRACAEQLVELAARETWSPATMQQWQLDRINALWSSARADASYYRTLSESLSLPPRFDSLEQFTTTMPVLQKEAARQRPDDFRSARAARGHWHRSSGSTGVPMRFFRSDTTHQSLLCQQYRFRQMWGLDLFDRSAFLGAGVPRAAAGLGGALDRMRQSATDAFRNRLRIDVHDLSPVALRRELHRIERFRPAYLYGYSRAIHLLALEALAQSFRCPSLRVVMLTSEPAFPHMIATVESAFRVPAVIEYGSVECGVIAYEWPDRKLRVRSDHVLVETLLRDDGRFDIVTTVLDNPDFPLFRYRIEDVTNAPLDLVDAAFPLLGNIAGRNDDVLFASDGSPVHPAEIDGVFEWASRPIVRRYRVHQNADGSIIVRIEPADTAKIDPAAIAQAIENKLRGRSVRVEIVDALEQTAAGKHRLITSDLQDGRWPAGAD